MQSQWTAEEIGKRLGLSTMAFPAAPLIGAREIAMVRQAGITRVEICGFHPRSHYDCHNRAQVSEIMTECRKQGVTIVAVHGPNIPYSCEYEEVRKGVVVEALVAAKAAEELGASVFVGHFGLGEQAEKTVCEMLAELGSSPLRLTVENLPGDDLRDTVAFVDKIGSEQFGITVDIGHPRDPDDINPFIKKDVARQTMAQCGKRLWHVHLHDFTDTDHIPPFDGNVQWGEIFTAFQDIGYEGQFMFEAGHVTAEEVLQKTADFPKTFVRRYGT